MKQCSAVERKETACRPYGCARYDCEKNKVTYAEALKRYKEYYPNQYKNSVIAQMNTIIHNQAVRDVQKVATKEVKK